MKCLFSSIGMGILRIGRSTYFAILANLERSRLEKIVFLIYLSNLDLLHLFLRGIFGFRLYIENMLCMNHRALLYIMVG